MLEDYKKKESSPSPTLPATSSSSSSSSLGRRRPSYNAPSTLATESFERPSEYTDAYDALKVLLSGARQLQHRYFSQSQVQETQEFQQLYNRTAVPTLAIPSESLRLELASTLATTSAVRDVHAVEVTVNCILYRIHYDFMSPFLF